MSERKRRLRSEIGTFVRQYGRKAQPGVEPNDRKYSRKIERHVKQMKPKELDDLLHGDDEEA